MSAGPLLTYKKIAVALREKNNIFFLSMALW
jgi:hypothetical protein